MSQHPSPDALFDEITRFVDNSKTLLESGAFVQLAGLDDQVRKLCESLILLSQEQRLKHADRLQQLLWSLSNLEETMMQYRDAIAEQVRGLSGHQKANVAYRTAEAIDNFKRDEDE